MRRASLSCCRARARRSHETERQLVVVDEDPRRHEPHEHAAERHQAACRPALADPKPHCRAILLIESFPLTSNRLAFLTNSRVYDVAKAQRVLGFTAATDLPTGMARSMAWYREHGHLPVPVTA